MSQQNAIERSRPQGARIETERARRRRRDDTGIGRLSNLTVAGTLDARYTYRWVNDEPGRIYQMTQADDWDIVKGEDLGADRDHRDRGEGTNVERMANKSTGQRCVLVRKLKEYYEEDEAKKQAHIDEIDRALRAGQVNVPAGVQSGSDVMTERARQYVPAGGISIQDGRKS